MVCGSPEREPPMTSIALSTHATARLSQRGVPHRLVDLVLAHGDITLHAGEDCESIRLSRDATNALAEFSELSPDDVARASRLVLIVNARGLITALRPARGARGRPYLRQQSTRSISA